MKGCWMSNSQVDVLSLVCHQYKRRQARIQPRLLRVREKHEEDKVREKAERAIRLVEAKKAEEESLRMAKVKKAEEERLRRAEEKKVADDRLRRAAQAIAEKDAFLIRTRDEQQRKLEESTRQRALASAKQRLEIPQNPLLPATPLPINVAKVASPSLEHLSASAVQMQVVKLTDNIRVALVRHGNNMRRLLQQCIGTGVTTVPVSDVLAIRRKTMASLKSFANGLRQRNAPVVSDNSLMKLIFEREKEIAQQVNKTKEYSGDVDQVIDRIASFEAVAVPGARRNEEDKVTAAYPKSFKTLANSPLPAGHERGDSDQCCSGQEQYMVAQSSSVRSVQGGTPPSTMDGGLRQSPLSLSQCNASLTRRSDAIGNNGSLQTSLYRQDNLTSMPKVRGQLWQQNGPNPSFQASSFSTGTFNVDLEPEPIKAFPVSTPNYKAASVIKGHTVTPQGARVWQELAYSNHNRHQEQAQRHEPQNRTHRNSHESTDDSRLNFRDPMHDANHVAPTQNYSQTNPTIFDSWNQVNKHHQLHTPAVQGKRSFVHPQEASLPDKHTYPIGLPQYGQVSAQARITVGHDHDCNPMMSQLVNQFMFEQQTHHPSNQHLYYQQQQGSTPSTPISPANHPSAALIQHGRIIQVLRQGYPHPDRFTLSNVHHYQQPETHEQMKQHFHAMYQQQQHQSQDQQQR
jgi:hypothetical protein